jgi:hypothetical protein
MSKKSILEQALLQVETLEEVMKANAKNILSSTMKKEIKEMLKEEDEEEDEEEVEEPKSQEKEDSKMGDDETSSDDESDETSDENDMSTTDNKMPNFMDDDDTTDESTDDDETLDLTNASDEEVIKVYKSLKPEDGVIVKKSGDDIKMKTDDEEYLIRLNDDDDMEEDDMNEMDSDYEMDYDEMNEMDSDYEMTDEMGEGRGFDIPDDYKFDGADKFAGSYDDEDDDEDSYEIDLGDEDDDEEMPNEKEFKESARTQGFGYHGGIEEKNIFKSGNKRKEMNEQITKLKKQNSEYKKALVLFKDKLNEVAVFNANLAYSTKLITENTTTKQEKINILKRFDNVDNITESKKLYERIKSELRTKKPIVENVVSKISNSPTTSTSKEVLTESKAYENPAFKRIKELMKKIN